MYVTQRGYCDFVIWTSNTLHVERITPDKVLIESALPAVQKFFKSQNYWENGTHVLINSLSIYQRLKKMMGHGVIANQKKAVT